MVAVTLGEVLSALLRIGGLALLSGGLTLVVAVGYRWYTRETVPEGIVVLLGLGVIAVYLNTTAGLSGAIRGDTALTDPSTAAFTIGAYVAGGVAADLGRRLGDYAAADVFAFVSSGRLETDVGEFVRSVGRVTTVTLPEDVADMDGYDPVAPETKESLVGEVLVFPRRLTVAELRDRLVGRLKDDYGVGFVDVEVTADGTVEYLGVGSRAAGIGPTLAPGTAAVAIRADPANTASPGDLVQVWHADPDPTRAATAELRATAGDVVTLALDETDARTLSDGHSYRLVTLPNEPSADREFASLLRAADETMGAATVDEDSPLVGTPLGALDVHVVAVRGEDGVEAIPKRTRPVAAGEIVYVIGRPEVLRKFEAAAGGATASGEAAVQANG